MLLQCSTSLSSHNQNNFLLAFSHPKTHKNHNLVRFKNPKRTSFKFTCVIDVGFDDIAQIAHNKVLIAAGVSGAIGQLSKPFTGSLLYGRKFDLKATVQAGGFPSSHSSSVVAAATCLALERGFADSLFGLALVYAGIIMYDAQGVRREVGIHAKALNKMVSNKRVNLIDSEEGAASNMQSRGLGSVLGKEEATSGNLSSESKNAHPVLLTSTDTKRMQTKLMVSTEEGRVVANDSTAIFKESIGHTEVEVVAGAILGLFVSLALYAIT